jgi:mono/diheme cytochrome c family protein
MHINTNMLWRSKVHPISTEEGGLWMKRSMLAIAAIAVLAPAYATAQSVGEAEFMNSCATCHGTDGTGQGPMAGFLVGSLPDLTTLSERNDGVFPVTRVYSTIDGTTTIGAHGSREMPVWGNRYAAEGARGANPDFRAEEAEVFARFRVLALTEYLASIQK